ncbi:transcriptional regulator [Bacillus sp. HMF5848]|uniref:DsrE family protein n=1 Tax=Bacillus sp. HMF5848 TaxID=2495421 RepID=UPI000F778974|nr:DsrE family protein [Bacillus sp. HMF5848]RSK26440.1 transcriptional regulator [Bacillus sp. HMF5848]
MKQKVILVSSTELGRGEKELGEGILETFFTLLKQREDKPRAIFCMNSGVYALTADSLVSVHLAELEQAGIEVLACKTCVDYYKLEDQLTVGKISSMQRFVELASDYEVITIS